MSTEPDITAFFDEPTCTVSYAVSDPASKAAVIIDPVLGFDPVSGRTNTQAAERILRHVREAGLDVQRILETHAHADHLSAAQYLKAQLGGQTGIGKNITQVQKTFAGIFNLQHGFACDGRQFDHLFEDGACFAVGALRFHVMATPGHTPGCISYHVGNNVFVGDTLFMPDYGTARADFPGGDAAALYRSIRKILSLPGETRLYMCHDYKAPGRDTYKWVSSVAEERAHNVHIHDGISEAQFVAMREARDKTLNLPRLLVPSIQVNIRAGAFPPPESNGVSYLKLPLNML